MILDTLKLNKHAVWLVSPMAFPPQPGDSCSILLFHTASPHLWCPLFQRISPILSFSWLLSARRDLSLLCSPPYCAHCSGSPSVLYQSPLWLCFPLLFTYKLSEAVTMSNLSLSLRILRKMSGTLKGFNEYS